MAQVRFFWHFYVMRPVFMSLLDGEERLVAAAVGISDLARTHRLRRARGGS